MITKLQAIEDEESEKEGSSMHNVADSVVFLLGKYYEIS